ncbi:l-threonine synthase [Halogeometricum borinquense DSM 11551]|uniref:L-threonine synthase n=2 Tax=Halogeometricum borinquense TaxID=60847 RepID=E4NRB7_HALBP|nr:threonine synthase [Halogeometricum borinquense]ADQ67958.1 L-threonine synthase [Halogeometricum borinquense DSM 11551]ELY24122.1 l-threonine synthase [Halogeometricum borinquense DSM 11551]RYJ13121.1 pyridoxal-phosphate dependent enzyme [Halogeometricum borinquense]
METREAFLGLKCAETGERYDASTTGESDAGVHLTPVYDLDAVDWADGGLADRPTDTMWRYADLLPFSSPLTANEGGTPLVASAELAAELGIKSLSIKDEGRNPTGTVLDRGLSPAVTAAREADAELVALASAGNAGQSAASYASMADLRSYAFVPSRAPFSNKAMVNVHGGEMRVVGGRYPDAEDGLHEQLQSDWFTLQEFDNPYRHDGIKTLAFEVAESLDWSVPDAVIVPTSTGEVVTGVANGFRQLRELGLIDEPPSIYAAQASGCAPIYAAHERGERDVEPWEHPDTIVGELEIPDPKGGAAAVHAVEQTDGDILAIDDEDILESAVVAAQTAGVEVGTAGGAAMAAAWQLAEDGVVGETDDVVVVNTESGTKTADILRSHLMGQGI